MLPAVTPSTPISNKRAASFPRPPMLSPSLPRSLAWWNSSCGDPLRARHAGSISHPAGLLLSLGAGVNGCRELGA